MTVATIIISTIATFAPLIAVGYAISWWQDSH